MTLSPSVALENLERQAEVLRQKVSFNPALALVWIGDDPQTAAFVRAKQAKAKKLNCDFLLHHFENANFDQIEALLKSLANKKTVQGIVLQLPLPRGLDADSLIRLIPEHKDVDNLHGRDIFASPTPTGIVDLLQSNSVDPSENYTVILGSGRLVGGPLADLFDKNKWIYKQIDRDATLEVEEIKKADVLIACTGVTNLVTPSMVSENMVVIDGSGVDIEVQVIEPLVKMITPKRGAIGPLTVSHLFLNLLQAAQA